jgi:glycosyltransferase involved in cell wall biosynthesis/predicted esterase
MILVTTLSTTASDSVLRLPTAESVDSQSSIAAPLSVVVPIFNEAATIAATLARVCAVPGIREIILVDDGSTDDTVAALDQLAEETNVYLIRHENNRGKGAALRTGFAYATGDIVIVQDADLEYDPADYETIIEPLLQNKADAVYGSRFLTGVPTHMPQLTRWANRLITWCSNRVFGLSLTDIETCYKAIRRDKLEQLLPKLHENRFGIEIELTARLTQLPGIRITERPISYSARSYEAGKKIGWRDGIAALWCIFRYRPSNKRLITAASDSPACGFANKRRFGWLEIALLASIAALLVQLVGPAALRTWQEWPRPGQQVAIEPVVTSQDGRQWPMPSWIYFPKEYELSGKCPLLLFLHGAGERGDDLQDALRNSLSGMVAKGKHLPMLVLSPQCPLDQRWDVDQLLGLLDYAQAKYSVDPDRIYVCGFSMGAYSTWELAAKTPERFAAIVPIAGGANVGGAKQLAKIPIWAFHGDQDRTVPLEQSTTIIEAIKKSGGQPRLSILRGEGHGIAGEVFLRSDLYPWMLAQNRKSQSKTKKSMTE